MKSANFLILFLSVEIFIFFIEFLLLKKFKIFKFSSICESLINSLSINTSAFCVLIFIDFSLTFYFKNTSLIFNVNFGLNSLILSIIKSLKLFVFIP